MTQARDLADLAGAADAGTITGRNLIINGAMTISQRGTTITNTTGSNFKTVDRVKSHATGGGSLDQEQSTDVPSGQGFINSLKTTVNTVDSSIAAGDFYGLEFPLEGQNVNGVSGFGTSGAKNLTLSFWVKSSVTGDYSVSFQNGATDISYVSKYTISAANTWEYKTINIDAKTDGTWVTTNAKGVRLWFSLGTGSTFSTSNEQTWESGNYVHITNTEQWISNSSATFYITGVQLEVGDTATPFEHESYDKTLLKCARYYYKFISDESSSYLATGMARNTVQAWVPVWLPAPLRSGVLTDMTLTNGGTFRLMEQGTSQTATSISLGTSFRESILVIVNVASGLAAGDCVVFRHNANTSFIAIDCEL